MHDPGNAVANYNMASAKIKLGKPREALPYALKAVEKDNGSTASLYVLGLTNEKLGNTDDAARYYSTAVQKDPKFAPRPSSTSGLSTTAAASSTRR